MLRTFLPALVLVAWHAPLLVAQDKTPRQPFAPLVNDSTQFVIRGDMEKLDLKKYCQMMKTLFSSHKLMAAFGEEAPAWQGKLLKAGFREFFLIVNQENPKSETQVFLIVPLPQNAEVGIVEKLAALLPGASSRRQGAVQVIGEVGPLKGLDQFQPKDRPAFAQGLKALAAHPAQVILDFPVPFREAMEKELAKLPKGFGDDVTLFTRGVNWLGAGFDTVKPTQLYMVQAKDAATAKELFVLGNQGLDLLAQTPGFKDVAAKLRSMIDLKVQGVHLSLEVDYRAAQDLLVQETIKVRASAARLTSINNLKQLALACYVHLDRHKTFPARANFDPDGKALLSWRVHLLPYLDEKELYKQFNLDEPWDSAHNKKLIARMPLIYRSPLSEVGKEGKTTYLVPVGKGAMFDGPKGVRLNEMKDGTSNTIMILEVADAKAVFWTQPDDFDVTGKNPLEGLARPELKGFHAAFADGAVRLLRGTMDLAAFRGLISIGGGEIVDPNAFSPP